MSKALLVFPHHLFAEHPGFTRRPARVVLVEDALFFGDWQYPARFHKQKLWLHRATMARYGERLQASGHTCEIAQFEHGARVLEATLERLASQGVTQIVSAEPVDYVLQARLEKGAEQHGLALTLCPTPMFLNSAEINTAYRADKKRWFMADFYKHQRTRLNVLMEAGAPAGGKWSFDEDNRKKVPKALQGQVPALWPIKPDAIDEAARASVEAQFPDAYGHLETLFWPTSHEEAARWLDTFLAERFELFGPYEDAILKGESLLWHSAITPMLNIGLLTPQQVLEATLAYAGQHDVPINSLEGFVRQLIGWREFMRATYDDLGVSMRTTNHWQHRRNIPQSFWAGTTGIPPIDDTIKRVLETGYCHHIERLMVLGGFMFLCEFDPDEIYRWFMEMFVDAYDWVMVPNVYAMSQHADGGQITTKPYFSGSAYVKKMSNHAKGDWCEIWDGLYWRWIWKQADALARNPRWAMMVSMARKMDAAKREAHLATAEAFLATLA